MLSKFPLFLVCLLLAACSPPSYKGAPPNVLARYIGQMRILRDSNLVALNETEARKFLSAPFTIVLFGASWCPECVEFSPKLVAAYNGQHAGTRRFEVLFFPLDIHQSDLLKYMRREQMPWPVIALDEMTEVPQLRKYDSGKGYPCLTVIDPEGKILLQSTGDRDAEEILRKFQDLVKTP